jgi:hypothetical protein
MMVQNDETCCELIQLLMTIFVDLMKVNLVIELMRFTLLIVFRFTTLKVRMAFSRIGKDFNR